MDDLLIMGDFFDDCLAHLSNALQRSKACNMLLNWEKCHFMVKEEIVLGHKISKKELRLTRLRLR